MSCLDAYNQINSIEHSLLPTPYRLHPIAYTLLPNDLLPNPYPTAFFTNATIFFSSADVSFFNAKATGHIAPSSILAAS